MKFDLADLAAFRAVIETGSFHAASVRLGLSQPAVTRRIQKLEEALGQTLFHRTTRAVKPTMAARQLRARAEALLDDAQELTRALSSDATPGLARPGPVVTIAAIPTIVARVLPQALHHASPDGPLPRLRLLDMAAGEVSDAVAAGEADFGLCSVPVGTSTTRFDPLFEDHIGCALPRDHPLAQATQVDLTDLADAPVILPAQGTGNRVLIDEALARANLSLAWRFEVSRSATALDLVAAGLGLALVPRAAMPPHLCWRALVQPGFQRVIGLLTRPGHTPTRAAHRIEQAIRATLGSSADTP